MIRRAFFFAALGALAALSGCERPAQPVQPVVPVPVPVPAERCPRCGSFDVYFSRWLPARVCRRCRWRW